MAQTDSDLYGFKLNIGHPGQKVDLGSDRVESFPADGTVHFGRGVVFNSDQTAVEVPSDDSQTFAGVSLFTHAQMQDIDMSAKMGEQFSDGAMYRDTDTVSVLRSGVVYVEVTEDVDAGDTAYVDVTSDSDDYGKFTDASDDGDGNDNIEAGVFRTSADTGELAAVEISLP